MILKGKNEAFYLNNIEKNFRSRIFKKTQKYICVQNTQNFVFKIWKMAEKIKTNCGQILVLTLKVNVPINFAKIGLFSISKPKVVYLRPFVNFLPFPKF